MADEEINSVQLVISNDDLLIEILVRLPALSLVFFKSVSKRWFSLIKQAANPTFLRNRNPDPPSGLFIYKGSCNYDFVPLDIRIPSFGPDLKYAEIFHSSNGLLLCCTLSRKLCVCNPSVSNMFKVLPQPDYVTCYNDYVDGGWKMAFDPTKSRHYKVVYAQVNCDPHLNDDMRVQIHIFSSETGDWSLCGNLFQHCFLGFRYGVYWNDAIYWSTGGEIFKLDIMNDHPVLTSLPTPPLTVDESRPTYLLYESHGCLLLVDVHIVPFRHYTIYEKRNVYSEWLVKYTVNLDDFAQRCRRERISCIVLGEREEDSFLVRLLGLGRKVVQHKLVSKTLSTISHLGPNDDGLHGCFQFIPSFANV